MLHLRLRSYLSFAADVVAASVYIWQHGTSLQLFVWARAVDD